VTNDGKCKIIRSIYRGNFKNFLLILVKLLVFKKNGTVVEPTKFGQVVQGKNGAHIIPESPNQD
jgi:hypothetical protein